MLAAAVRFAIAIVLDALAFIVWDIGTRPPSRLLHDVAGARRRPAAIGRAALRFAAGLALLVAGALSAESASPTAQAFSVLETGTVAAALIVEALLGPGVHARFGAAPRR